MHVRHRSISTQDRDQRYREGKVIEARRAGIVERIERGQRLPLGIAERHRAGFFLEQIPQLREQHESDQPGGRLVRFDQQRQAGNPHLPARKQRLQLLADRRRVSVDHPHPHIALVGCAAAAAFGRHRHLVDEDHVELADRVGEPQQQAAIGRADRSRGVGRGGGDYERSGGLRGQGPGEHLFLALNRVESPFGHADDGRIVKKSGDCTADRRRTGNVCRCGRGAGTGGVAAVRCAQ